MISLQKCFESLLPLQGFESKLLNTKYLSINVLYIVCLCNMIESKSTAGS